MPVAEDGRAQRAARPPQRERPAARRRPRRLAADGALRAVSAPSDAAARGRAVALWEAAAAAHRPAERVEVVIGPVTAYSCSVELLRDASRRRAGPRSPLPVRAARRRWRRAGRARLGRRRPAAAASPTCPGPSRRAHACRLDVDDTPRSRPRAPSSRTTRSNPRLGSACARCAGCPTARRRRRLRRRVLERRAGHDRGDQGGRARLDASPDYCQWPRAARRSAAHAAARPRSGRRSRGPRRARPVRLTLWDLTALSLPPRNDLASTLALGRPSAGPPRVRRARRGVGRGPPARRARRSPRSTSAAARGSGTRRAPRARRGGRTRRRRRPSTTAAPRTSTAPRSTSTATRRRAARARRARRGVAALGRPPRRRRARRRHGHDEWPRDGETRRKYRPYGPCAPRAVVRERAQPEASGGYTRRVRFDSARLLGQRVFCSSRQQRRRRAPSRLPPSPGLDRSESSQIYKKGGEADSIRIS